MVYYFAYGSNMSKKQMDERLGINNYSLISSGKLRNYRLIFNKTPRITDNPKQGYANIVPDIGSIVEGIIYEIDDIGLSKLDKYEGLLDLEYYREQIIIQSQLDKDNKEIKEILCEIYIARPEKTKEGLKPSKEYLFKLLAGKNSLSEGYIKYLENTKTID